MRIMGIDTALTTGSVALIQDEQIVAEYILNVRATHSERLLPALDKMLRDTDTAGNDLDGIAVATGPGSFTGLRIGVATAKALAYTWRKPLIGVSTLEGLAFQVGFAAPWVCALVDAGHHEVYGCLYESRDLPRPVLCPQASSVQEFIPEVLELATGKVCFVGDGAVVYRQIIADLAAERLVAPPLNSVYLRASSVALVGRERLRVGEKHNPLTLAPMYLRLPEAERRRRAKKGL